MKTAAPESNALGAVVGNRRAGLRWRHGAAPLSLIGFGLVATAYFGLSEQHEPGLIPPCLFLSLTGLDCPLCGGSRAIHDLIRGNALEAADHNILVVMAVPIMAVVVILWTVRRLRPETRNDERRVSRVPNVLAQFVSAKLLVTTAVLLLLLFAIIRNVPTFSIFGASGG